MRKDEIIISLIPSRRRDRWIFHLSDVYAGLAVVRW
jgi:hypothetical protein